MKLVRIHVTDDMQSVAAYLSAALQEKRPDVLLGLLALGIGTRTPEELVEPVRRALGATRGEKVKGKGGKYVKVEVKRGKKPRK